MASAGTGMLFDSLVNVSGTSSLSYTVPSGYVFCGQAVFTAPSGSISVGYVGFSGGGVALGIVMGGGGVIYVSCPSGSGNISGALFKNP